MVACCDRNAAKSKSLADRFGLRAYSDAGAMLAAEAPDLVHVATPPAARVELLELVSQAGIPACTVEKPLATGVTDWLRMNALARETRTRIAVCHQFRWYPGFRRCAEAVRSGKLGTPLFLDLSAGMNIAGQGTHILDYSFALLGDGGVRVTQVFGAATGRKGMSGFHPGPDGTAGYLTYSNGTRALWINGGTAPRCGDPTTDWQHVRLACYASRGRVLWEEFGRWEIEGAGEVDSGRFPGVDAWKRDNLRAQAAFHETMLAWIDADSERPGNHFTQSLHEWKVVLALYASATERRPIDLDAWEPPADLFARLDAALGA
jgi:predicted dehydrogenase